MTADKQKSAPVYISDLDGTLLRDDASLSNYARDTLRKLLRAGVNFTVASARAASSIRYIMKDLPLSLPVIEINGAFITEFATGRHLVINQMPTDLVQDIYRLILRYNCRPFLTTTTGDADHLYYDTIANDGMLWYYENRHKARDHRLQQTDRLQSCFTEHVVGLTVINTGPQLRNLAQHLLDEYKNRLEMHFFENPYSPPWHWLTIHDKTACKSRAIPELLEYANLDPAQLTVFGDNLNDANMFRTAPRAVAVENATDQIKSLATQVIGPNSDDAVIKFINQETNLNF
ncbi:Pyridoxal phosphate phosphatase YigL [Anaerohalosphaera lusitana]|uniref:Pyridoxal phosphate phosphatase YigL n=1 Tax=Anaerohalosphaera lusitana TaxID=1936003 RepID=A0A1U9NHT9_9BACT|nr:HAD hydrolase family protein [Anaerohalosphaera lusitana]AQT67170.1 Pyridoxal phosphate phosphatase YigL [Anaerohalosphaera lusitana]